MRLFLSLRLLLALVALAWHRSIAAYHAERVESLGGLVGRLRKGLG